MFCSQSEKQYCLTRKELLAVVQDVRHFHVYLYGNRFLVRTDHSSLQQLLSFKSLEGQMARWAQKLGQYNFEIKYQKENLHSNADLLSRRPCRDTGADIVNERRYMNSVPRTILHVISVNRKLIGYEQCLQIHQINRKNCHSRQKLSWRIWIYKW